MTLSPFRVFVTRKRDPSGSVRCAAVRPSGLKARRWRWGCRRVRLRSSWLRRPRSDPLLFVARGLWRADVCRGHLFRSGPARGAGAASVVSSMTPARPLPEEHGAGRLRDGLRLGIRPRGDSEAARGERCGEGDEHARASELATEAAHGPLQQAPRDATAAFANDGGASEVAHGISRRIPPLTHRPFQRGKTA